jgi:hypothetical protein
LETFNWKPVVELIVTLIDGSGAIATLYVNSKLSTSNGFLIEIKLVIVLLLIHSFVKGLKKTANPSQ